MCRFIFQLGFTDSKNMKEDNYAGAYHGIQRH